MLQKSRFIVLLCVTVVALTGCFQQASEVIEPLGTSVPVDSMPTSGSIDMSSAQGSDPTSIPATPTLSIDITILSPTRQLPATNTPVTEPQVVPTTESEVQFVTPGGPLGPVTVAPIATLQTPATATPSGLITPTAFSSGSSEDGCTYTVQSGDTLFRIATRNDTTVADLRAANNLSGDIIQPGQVLQIPGCGATQTETEETSESSVVVEPLTAGGDVYTVKAGDTLFTIAQQFGTTVRALQEANNLSDPDRLSVGQQLIIPSPSN
jgi:LysM repeat protein